MLYENSIASIMKSFSRGRKRVRSARDAIAVRRSPQGEEESGVREATAMRENVISMDENGIASAKKSFRGGRERERRPRGD